MREADVAKRYKIGRTPFREACNRLLQQQLVEFLPRHGFVVRAISLRDAVDIFEFRLMLELSSAELAIVRGRDYEIDRLSEELENSSNESGIEDIIEANTRFHLRLAEMSGNGQLVRTIAQLLERYESLSYAEARNKKSTPQLLKNLHEPIVKALRMRDSTALRAAICEDLFATQDLILPRHTSATAIDVPEILKKVSQPKLG